ncbi:MAG: phosphate acyltransferase [Fidelibacterota bacterium]
MIRHFREIHKMLRSFKPARLAVANPQQVHLQKILAKSEQKEIIKPLVFLNDDPAIAAIKAVEAVASGKADFLMKGDIDTAQFIQIVLNKKYGLRNDKLLSHVAVIETPFYNRPMLCSDGVINIKLNKETVPAILENALLMASSLGIKKPNVAFLSLVETITSKLPSTELWDQMTNKYKSNPRLTAEGPLALDIALSAKAAEKKSFKSRIAGKADIFIGPTITSINMMVKSLINIGGAKGGGLILGAKCPIVLLSRSDSKQTHMNSVALGLLALNRH